MELNKFVPIVSKDGKQCCFFCGKEVEVRSSSNDIKYYHPQQLCYAWKEKFGLILLVGGRGVAWGVLEQSMIDALLKGKYGSDLKAEITQFLTQHAKRKQDSAEASSKT